MQAAVLERYGDHDALEVREAPEPRPGPEDVLLEVHAASVNPIDWKTRDGQVRALLAYELPQVLGSDASGVVREVGPRVSRFQPGDEVFTRVDKRRIGTFAELVAVHQDDVAKKPATLDHLQAASLPLVSLTALQGLVDRCQLEAGQQVFIQAGSGGVGTAAIQIAKALGAGTVATTAGARNLDLVRQLGANVALDYRAERYEEELRGYDVALDVLGGASLRRSMSILDRGGHVVTILGMPDAATFREYGHPLLAGLGWLANLKWRRLARRRGIRYHYLLMRSSGRQLERIAAWVDAGRLRPVIDAVLPLAEAAEALRLSKAGHATGKIVLQVR